MYDSDIGFVGTLVAKRQQVDRLLFEMNQTKVLSIFH